MPAVYSRIADLFETRTVHRGQAVYPLPTALLSHALTYQIENRPIDVNEFISRNDVAEVLLLKDGKIVLERYRTGQGPATLWPSWSVTKSITSTLVGAAVKDGYIQSLEDPVIKYLPSLRGSAFDGTSIRNLLQMSSGIKFNEDYEDPQSDFSRLLRCYEEKRKGCVLQIAKTVARDNAPGLRFHYSTLDSTVLGLAVIAATHKKLADYLSEKVWSVFGMESDALWVLESKSGDEFGGALLAATLRDYGRLGEFILNDGKARNQDVLPEKWVEQATHPRPDSPQINYGQLRPGVPYGYGYSWWLFPAAQRSPDGEEAFAAIGIFGQQIYVNKKEKLVAVFLCSWSKPWNTQNGFEVTKFLEAAIRALR